MEKRSLSERDICTKFITPARGQAWWEAGDRFPASSGLNTQVFDGRIPRIN